MRVWGITGTNGKTTTAWVFAEFVNAVPGRKCGYITTVEVFDGARRFSTGYTTPPLKQLREIFAAMEENGCTDCVMEVSSHALSQNRTGETRFAGGAFTNLTEDHLDYHKTMEAYFAAKLELAKKVASGAQTRPDMGRGDLPPFVVAMDGEGGREMFNAAGNLSVNVIGVSVAHSAYDLSRLPLVGEYNRSNVLVAAALAEAAGVPRGTVQAVIPRLAPRWGRLERVENPEVAAEVYVDFAHTPDGLDKVLAAARGFTPGRLWVVFGAGGDRDPIHLRQPAQRGPARDHRGGGRRSPGGDLVRARAGPAQGDCACARPGGEGGCRRHRGQGPRDHAGDRRREASVRRPRGRAGVPAQLISKGEREDGQFAQCQGGGRLPVGRRVARRDHA